MSFEYARPPMAPLQAPKLSFREEGAVSHILSHFDSQHTLIVCCPHYYQIFSKLNHTATLMCFKTPDAEKVENVLRDPKFIDFDHIIGIGGGVSTDVAKALGANKKLYVYPTLLSTNCLSNNRSVLCKNGESFSYPSGNPIETIICLPELLETTLEHRIFWTQAGYGDFVAELSAAIEKELIQNASVHNFDKVIAHDPDVWNCILWIANQYPQNQLFERNFMIEFAKILHSTSAKVLEAGGNATRIGSEHDLYKALLNIDPSLRHSGPPHGTITGLGTLLITKIYEKVTSNSLPYTTLRTSFEKMQMPLNYKALEGLNLTKSKIQQALSLLKQDPEADRFLKHYINTHGDSFLDEVLSP